MVVYNLKENFVDIFLGFDYFLSTPTSFSDPFFWYICTISDLINSSHDSLEMASKHATYILLSLSLIHISEPTRLGMISYAVFCLKKKKKKNNKNYKTIKLK